MSMALNNGGRGRSRRGAPIGEINVTPLVDVMLVLLIVFMVSAPLLTAGVPIDLPKTQTSGLIDAERVLKRVQGLAFTHFNSGDVVRHPLVARIVDAYDATRKRH